MKKHKGIRPMAFKFKHASESSGVLFKTDCWAPPSSFKWIGGRGVPTNFHF